MDKEIHIYKNNLFCDETISENLKDLERKN